MQPPRPWRPWLRIINPGVAPNIYNLVLISHTNHLGAAVLLSINLQGKISSSHSVDVWPWSAHQPLFVYEVLSVIRSQL